MFRDDRQLAAVCDALTRWMGKGQLWSADGITDAGARLAKRPGALSSGERLMLAFALSIWNSYEFKGPSTDDLLAVLDPTRMRKVATLLYATTEDEHGVDRWLERNHPDMREEEDPS